MNTAAKLGLALAATAGTFVLSATPASAHTVTATHGRDYARVGQIDGLHSHQVVQVVDKECDGHRVYVVYREEGNSAWESDYDRSGCEGGGLVLGTSAPIDRFRVCEISVGCGTVVYL